MQANRDDVNFQSYQGSIFTKELGFGNVIYTDFQSYQGSIFTQIVLSLSVPARFSFNPIKVLFLPVTFPRPVIVIFLFQSYQGSIFTRFVSVINCW